MSKGIALGTPAASPATRAQAAFSGENGEFRRLVVRGALLELVTFGFYRFWLATNIRRQLWSNTSAGGDALEYTGTARELLVGFLFALAILVPIYLVYFVIGIEAERWKAFASVPLGLLYYGFWQFAVYRARRYRLTRTSWRGVRFWMTGSGTAYAARAFGWTLLTVVTLGLAYPWRAAALERYKMGHTFYGDLPRRFDGKGWDFFKRSWWLWPSVWLILVAVYVHTLGPFLYVGLGSALGSYVNLKWSEWKWWAQGLRLGDVRFDSNLERKTFFLNSYSMALLLAAMVFVATVTFFWAISYIFLLVWGIDFQRGHPSPPFIALFALNYLALILALGTVYRIYLVQRIWKLVVSSITVENLDAADHVVAKGEAASAIGEGRADSLDVAAF